MLNKFSVVHISIFSSFDIFDEVMSKVSKFVFDLFHDRRHDQKTSKTVPIMLNKYRDDRISIFSSFDIFDEVMSKFVFDLFMVFVKVMGGRGSNLVNI
jgi:hypothetical protein